MTGVFEEGNHSSVCPKTGELETWLEPCNCRTEGNGDTDRSFGELRLLGKRFSMGGGVTI